MIYEIIRIESVTSDGVQVASLSEDGRPEHHFLRFYKICNIQNREIKTGGHYKVTPGEKGLKIELV